MTGLSVGRSLDPQITDDEADRGAGVTGSDLIDQRPTQSFETKQSVVQWCQDTDTSYPI